MHAVPTLADAQEQWSPAGVYLKTASYGLPPRDGLEAMRQALSDWRGHDSYFGPPLRLATDAHRFDTSPAWFSWVGAQPALELVNRIGVHCVYEHDVALANRFRAGLGLEPSNSAIVSVARDGAAERLERAGIRAALRGGRLRASWHLYNTESDVEAALDALAQ